MKPFIHMVCPLCGSTMVFREGQYGNFYKCVGRACKATHGVHKGTTTPLGVPADQETRQARIRCHEAFDSLWKVRRSEKQRKMRRGTAYVRLQKAMGMTSEECHIGRFTKQQCEIVIRLVESGSLDHFIGPDTPTHP